MLFAELEVLTRVRLMMIRVAFRTTLSFFAIPIRSLILWTTNDIPFDIRVISKNGVWASLVSGQLVLPSCRAVLSSLLYVHQSHEHEETDTGLFPVSVSSALLYSSDGCDVQKPTCVRSAGTNEPRGDIFALLKWPLTCHTHLPTTYIPLLYTIRSLS